MTDITFRYNRAPTGELSGESLVEQTEQALSEISTESSQAKVDAAEALRIANLANQAAREAVSTATTAAETATAAQSTAQTAQATATTALNTAQTASMTASAAQSTANTAATTANTASATATAAQTAATNAGNTATTALNTAQNAQSTATQAATDASAAQTAAQTSANAAQNSANAATAAQTAAESAEAAATTSQTSAQASAQLAANSATSASTSATDAQAWAEGATSPNGQPDADSPTGYTQSSKSWAQTAESLVTQGYQVVGIRNSAAAHNCLYRGDDLLGSGHFADYDDLSNALQADDYSDIFIGDYIDQDITVSGTTYSVRWVVAAINYFKNVGDYPPQENHLVLIPHGVTIGSAPIGSVTNGFQGTAMWTTTLPLYSAAIQTAFGVSHVLKHRRWLSNAVNTNLNSANNPELSGAVPVWGASWVETLACLMDFVMVTGSAGSSSSAMDNAGSHGQFPLFRIANEEVCIRQDWWLSSLASFNGVGLITSVGLSIVEGVGNAFGVRPYFLFY